MENIRKSLDTVFEAAKTLDKDKDPNFINADIANSTDLEVISRQI